jgi:acetylornithine/succinyldiaminopimelate/putrescine aminotransferase
MKQKIILNTIILSFIFLISSYLHASETAVIDNKIIEYKGFSGQWIENSSSDALEAAIKTISSGEKDIIAANGSDYKTKKTVNISGQLLILTE